ncbi:hypothetical protein DXG01_007434 [Tephrocybe rancida]|nr:hypothetical protein DXG01_007434 [Tephrocybe rancida]
MEHSWEQRNIRELTKVMRLLAKTLALLCAVSALAKTRRGLESNHLLPRQSNGLQDIVTWDEYSLLIHGKRVMIFSGEVHPFRNPVQSLHLDVFEKVKALGFNAVSFYVHWGLIEYKRGEIAFDGFRDLQPFFDAAKKAGIYLIARPGPYINAESTGGGLPGWGTHTEGLFRTMNATYIEAMSGYMKAVGTRIAENQITKGGPVILVQAENEYSGFQEPYTEDLEYEAILIQQLLDAGITVPTTTNDAWPGGHLTGVDIYGTVLTSISTSPLTPLKVTILTQTASTAKILMFGSPMRSLSTNFEHILSLVSCFVRYFYGAHLGINPNAPNAVYEFQGGAFDGWGGAGYEKCSQLLGPEFERVFYKNQMALSTTIFNIYMIYGGSNWGGLGNPGIYSSYDYGSAIAEDRTLREKYYEIKLQANFLAVSPAFLTTRPQNIFATQGAFTGNSALKTTQILDVVGNKTGFYVVRQTDASTNAKQTYTLTVATSIGNVTVPTIGGSLTLNGKDSKIHVVDYTAGSSHILYSSAEIFTWATIDGKDVIVVYGNAGELHETAFTFSSTAPVAKVLSGPGSIQQKSLEGNSLALQFTTTGQTVVQVGSILLYVLDRANAYEFWVLHPPTAGDFAHYSTENPIIVKGGYLVRSVSIGSGTLAIQGDLNSTSTFEIIAPSASSKSVTFNGEALKLSKTTHGTLTAKRTANLPNVAIPKLSSLTWKTADSLPEIKATYSDDKWTVADHNTTVNARVPTTPVVLYAGDYGYHNGALLWRAHFNATGSETAFNAGVQGGSAFAYSVWLDSTFLGSWEGDATHADYNGTFTFPSPLKQGSAHVLTILQDHMGLEQSWAGASDYFKTPRGVLNYSFSGTSVPTVSVWKVTGNLGGEDDGIFLALMTRNGPPESLRLAVRLLASASTGVFFLASSSSKAKIFFRTTFDLKIPKTVDYPLSLVVGNSTTNPHFRSQFYVNGYHFGKYINNIGPQSVYPVPEGILNYNGRNTLAVSVWAAESGGAKLESLDLELTAKVETGRAAVVNQPAPTWTQRRGAY